MNGETPRVISGTCAQCGHSLSHDVPVIIGDWVIDPSGVTTFKGERLALTPQENEVLLVIAKANGRAVNNPSIEIRLEFDGESNIVTSLVCRIRQKMNAAFGFNTLETVQRRGYRWKV